MKKRIFWLLLIPGILFLSFNFHSHPTPSTPATLTKEHEPDPSVKNSTLIMEADHRSHLPIEDPTIGANLDFDLPAGLEKESRAEIYAEKLGTSDLMDHPNLVANEEPITITSVEYWLAPDQTQVVINLDRSLSNRSYRTFTLADPPRLVVELTQGKYLRTKETIQVHDKAVKRIRLQRLTSGRFQVVFDLIHLQTESKVFLVEKVNNQPDRLMVNILHPKEKGVESKKKQQVVQNLKQQNYKIVVIDPGHGGSDSGAIGRSGAMEKSIVLSIARKLKSRLDQTRDIKAYLTRDGDYFLSLARRTQIAREYGADLFISIHVNANHDINMNGFSVYCLSQQATDEAAKLLAQRENAADYIGGIVFAQEDPQLNEILLDLSQSASLNRSLEFGVLILEKTIPRLKVRNEGLKRANFAVLRAPDVPSVLVEALYISNPYEEQILRTPSMQDRLAEALYQSIESYFEQFHSPRYKKDEMVTSLKKTETSVKSVYSDNLFPAHQTVSEDKSLNQSAPSGELVSSQPATNPDQLSVQRKYRIHTVKEGETLWRIANLYKVDVDHLMEANRLKNLTIYTGQKLKIP